jgi:hypothetical protein
MLIRTARTEEDIARTELVQQLHRNRGSLRAEHPRDRHRVSSYFKESYDRFGFRRWRFEKRQHPQNERCAPRTNPLLDPRSTNDDIHDPEEQCRTR